MSGLRGMLAGEGLRFLVAGGVNTLLGYGIYLGLLQLLPYPAAYTGSFAIGILLSYALNTWFVFRRSWSWKALFAYPLVYLVQYVAGLALVTLFVEWLGLDAVFAPLFAVAVTLPLTFFLSRLIIKGKPP